MSALIAASFGIMAQVIDSVYIFNPAITEDTVIYAKITPTDEASPGMKVDESLVLSQDPIVVWDDYSMSARTIVEAGFTTGILDARNGGAFEKLIDLTFNLNESVEIWYEINMANETYNVWGMVPGLGLPAQFAADYAFRKTNIDTIKYASCLNNANGNALKIDTIIGVHMVGDVTTDPPDATGVIKVGAASINVFPNPVTNMLNLSGVKNTTISIYNVIGTMVQTISTQKDDITIDVSGIKSGIYFVKIRMDNETFVAKVFKR